MLTYPGKRWHTLAIGQLPVAYPTDFIAIDMALFSRQRGRSHLRTAATVLATMAPDIATSLTPQQRAEVERLVTLAVPKPAPKLVDLRWDIDLLVSRFYVVLLVGKDRRQTARNYPVSRLTAVGNWLAAVVLLLGLNVSITLALFLLAYLCKSALNINLFPGHLRGLGQ